MNQFIKFMFTVFGGAAIGFGLGVMAYKNAIFSASQFEAAMILGLIAGGFFLALGLPGKKIRRDEEEPAAQENSRQYPQS